MHTCSNAVVSKSRQVHGVAVQFGCDHRLCGSSPQCVGRDQLYCDGQKYRDCKRLPHASSHINVHGHGEDQSSCDNLGSILTLEKGKFEDLGIEVTICGLMAVLKRALPSLSKVLQPR